MENVSNISSEEELLQLRSSGKISEAEYRELLTSVRKTPSEAAARPAREANESESKHKRGKIALTLMLVGIILPAFFYFMIELLSGPNTRPAIAPWFFLGVATEIAALVMGVLAWPDDLGKATVVTTAIVAALTLLVLFLTL